MAWATVLPLLLKEYSSSPKEVLPLRRVCTEWRDLIGEDPIMNGLCFHLSSEASIKAFRSLSPSLKLKHFRFEKVDLEEKLFGDAQVFRNFTRDHCPVIKELYMNDCKLPMARFFELVAFCRSLDDLGIRCCPSVFQADMGILHWGFCFQNVRANLANVESLQVTEERIEEVNFWGMVSEMRALKRVNIGLHPESVGLLPRLAIMNLLANNSATLTELSLMGKLFQRVSDDDEFLTLENFPRMTALTSLKLMRGQHVLPQHSEFIRRFLGKCTNLRQLFLSEVAIQRDTLTSVEGTLEDLRISKSSFGEGTFKNANMGQLSNLKIMASEKWADATRAMGSLFQRKNPKLETLHLQLTFGGEDFLKYMTRANLPQLRGIQIIGCRDVRGPGLRQFFREFRDLQTLELKNCMGLVDGELCPLMEDNVWESLGNLINLEKLDLSRTSIGNQTVTDCIFRMVNLQFLLIDQTNVDKTGIRSILEARNNLLPSLLYVSLTGMNKFVLTRSELAELERIAPEVTLNCNSTF